MISVYNKRDFPYIVGVVGVEAVDRRDIFGLLGGFPGETGRLRYGVGGQVGKPGIATDPSPPPKLKLLC